MEQSSSFLWRQVSDSLEVQRDRFTQRAEHFLQRAALDREVEMEADRLPVAIPTFSIAAQTSGRQTLTLFERSHWVEF